MKKLFLVAALAVSSFFAANAQLNVGLNLGMNKVGGGDYYFDGTSPFDIGVRVGGLVNEKLSWNVGLGYGLPAGLNSGGEKMEGVTYSHIILQGHVNYFLVGYADEAFGLYIPFGASVNIGKFNFDEELPEDSEVDNPLTPTIDFGIGGNFLTDQGIGIYGEFVFGLPANFQSGGDNIESGAKLGSFLGVHFGVYKQF